MAVRNPLGPHPDRHPVTAGAPPAAGRRPWLGAPAVVLIAFAVLVLLRLAFAPFNIPSSSMAPSILPGDTILVSSFRYGLSGRAVPLAPKLFAGRILASQPQRGDVVVFKTADAADYVKRVVGLPGDRVQVTGGRLVLNGQTASVRPLATVTVGDGGNAIVEQSYTETLPGGGPSYTIAKLSNDGPANNTPEFTVPAGSLFVLGDNRDNSVDSRFAPDSPDPALRMPQGTGFVPQDNLVGQAALVVPSLGHKPGGAADIRWGRTLAAIR